MMASSTRKSIVSPHQCLQKMYSSRDKKPDPFYKPPNPAQKTSAEIINEARNSLRTLKTKRPFTPREDQRKLFGTLSSRTPDNRPPSSFSLHSCSFESSDSRPVSGTRLSPLPHKPKLPSPDTEDEITAATPQPPSHAVPLRKPNRTRVLIASSHGNIVADSRNHYVKGVGDVTPGLLFSPLPPTLLPLRSQLLRDGWAGFWSSSESGSWRC
ncbi:hypothetical protein GDO81_008045 [Engystomops pustulosus]|uniref:Uncharacterized protein n=1 Tax=Engystomops pustulosus TaxID=76066 RepID=A0AAV7CBM7_ENGPU|nr:hypothetical protein GDO81_008045 [Engystomops pustulosus]